MVDRIQQLQHHFQFKTPKQQTQSKSASFKDVLAKEKSLKVSKHAQLRLDERNIHISESQWEEISEKMKEARGKGVTDSLVVLSDAALLVSTQNHTVVTAMKREETQSKVFTNINGTILM